MCLEPRDLNCTVKHAHYTLMTLKELTLILMPRPVIGSLHATEPLYAPVCTTNPQILVIICCIHIHIHHMSRIPFLSLSFLGFVVFVAGTLIFP